MMPSKRVRAKGEKVPTGRGSNKSSLKKATTRGQKTRKEDASEKERRLPNETRRIREILRRLAKEYPEAKSELVHKNAFEMLVATVLSAQCTDAKVNEVTPELFARYPTPEDLARADLEDVERIIRPTGFYRNKAKAIVAIANALSERFEGKVPSSMEDLTSLPGVGRKTAAVVQATALASEFPRGPEGIAVDTHVFRLSRRLGLASANNAETVEAELMEKIPRKEWGAFSLRLILHGRRVCKARKPLCERCVLEDLCPSAHAVA
jgi:endonuclease-3